MTGKNLMDMLGAQAQKTAKTPKKKDEAPTLNLENNEKNRRTFDNWVKFKRDEVSAEANKKKEEETLKALVTEARTKFCLDTKSFHKSVKIRVGEDQPDKVEDGKIIPGRKSEIITASFQDKASKIDLKSKEELEEIFEKDYSKFFKMTTNIALTDAAMAKVETDSAAGNPTILNKIMDALGGPEEFFKVFEITQEITPRSALFEMQNLDTDVNAKVKKAEGILKIQKPSLLI